jgi:excisionase family DNA binding protein
VEYETALANTRRLAIHSGPKRALVKAALVSPDSPRAERHLRALVIAARAFADTLDRELDATEAITVPFEVADAGMVVAAAPPPPPCGDPPLLLTAQEAANLLRTSRKAVYALVERGELAGVTRLGRRVLFDRAELRQLLAERRAASPGRKRR